MGYGKQGRKVQNLGSSLFQAGEDETKDKNLELKNSGKNSKMIGRAQQKR
jgi:hypothetical protein